MILHVLFQVVTH
uniref:Uncharacterized protein n=1 Tax=Lepeophtheirus salmonis TaxID=72036 RepID=A0A0K2T1V5_LEPSM